MKRITLFLAATVLLSLNCSEDTTTNPKHCIPVFHAESLQVEVLYTYNDFLQKTVTDVRATFEYELECFPGTIYRYSMSFDESDAILNSVDPTVDSCVEPADVQLDKTVTLSALDELFAGYDSITVYFTLTGVFQRCKGGLTDSIAPISWTDTVVTQL